MAFGQRDPEIKRGRRRVETGLALGSVVGGPKEEGSVVSIHRVAEGTAPNFDPRLGKIQSMATQNGQARAHSLASYLRLSLMARSHREHGQDNIVLSCLVGGVN